MAVISRFECFMVTTRAPAPRAAAGDSRKKARAVASPCAAHGAAPADLPDDPDRPARLRDRDPASARLLEGVRRLRGDARAPVRVLLGHAVPVRAALGAPVRPRRPAAGPDRRA